MSNTTDSVREAAQPLAVDFAEVARLLNVSVKTIKRMAADGELPGVMKIRRRTLVSLAVLKAWIERKSAGR